MSQPHPPAWIAALLTLAVMFVLGALGLPGSVAPCRAADVNDFQTWWDISTIYNFNGRWRYAGDQGMRGIVSNEEWKYAYVRPAIRYTVRPWVSLHGGIGFAYTYQKFPGDRFEIRPWLGARFYWPRPGGFVFSHYFRLEDRYNYSEFRDTWDSAFRARYKLGLKTPTFSVVGADGFYVTTSLELFKELSGALLERFANRGRIDIGPGKHFGESWRAELHYLYQSSGLFIQEGIQTDEHILRLRLFYVFN